MGTSGRERPPYLKTIIFGQATYIAATKVCQNMIAKIYTTAYDMELIMVRAFNHIGPKQAPIFVVSDFCKQVVEIEKGVREPGDDGRKSEGYA